MNHVENAAILLREVLSKNDITSEDISKLYEVIDSLESDHRWAGIFQKGYTVMYTKDGAQTKELLSDKFLRAFASELLNTDSLEDILKSKVWKEAWKAKNAGGTVLTSIASILRPDLFLPVHSGTVKENLAKELEVDTKFYYPHGNKSIKQTSEFLITAYKAAGTLGVENMLEMAFYLSKYQETKPSSGSLEESEDETELGGSKPSNEHPIFAKLDRLLARKDQVILYGPPGTGKTWIASEYVKTKVPEGFHSFGEISSLRDDIKYYILVMNTAKYDISLIKEGLEETFSGKLQQAFDEIEEGDLAFVYLARPIKRIIALAECTGKTEEGTKFKIIKLVNGPTYDEMKSEEPIKSSLALRTMLRGTLFPLSSEEASWIASKIGFENLMDIGILIPNTARKFKAVEFVTFHPAFSYEDFIEGIKPETYIDPKTGKRELLFKVEEGVFKRIAREAYNALLSWAGIKKEWTENSGVPELTPEERNILQAKLKRNHKQVPKFYLVIDEINRADIPKVFGELITLLETDKRLFMDHEATTTLPYSKKTFGVPPNLYIIGTMNTSDRSIALIDVALRRRFGFIELMPDYDVLRKQIIDKASRDVKPIAGIAVSALKILNKRIRREYDRDHQIGHSYYLRLKEYLNDKNAFLEELKMIWFHEILPLLQEYFYDSPEKLKNVLKSNDPTSSFLKIERDVEDIVELKDEKEFSDEAFLQALKSLIEAESE
ncbi:MAG TPA: AAA domain-containing protein [Thermococcaceae archaeon]|nr:AAA domain-containing protein [Thermococcaceae archaeon]